jgi:excisionase family DNA binding protein
VNPVKPNNSYATKFLPLTLQGKSRPFLALPPRSNSALIFSLCDRGDNLRGRAMRLADPREVSQMSTTTAAPGAAPTRDPAALLDVHAVAALLDCSARHVYRLADAGRMPRPLKIGALVRWRRADLDEWLVAGCPAVRRIGG